MAHKLKAVLLRESAAYWQDALGAAALVVMLMVGLHLPVLV
ncbi:hypothetical protein [Phaeovulum sp.]